MRDEQQLPIPKCAIVGCTSSGADGPCDRCGRLICWNHVYLFDNRAWCKLCVDQAGSNIYKIVEEERQRRLYGETTEEAQAGLGSGDGTQ